MNFVANAMFFLATAYIVSCLLAKGSFFAWADKLYRQRAI